MSGNTELLNFVYQNSQMGIESLSQLIELSDDEEFKECMEKQLEKYREFNKEARRLLEERGHNEKSIGMFDRLKTYLMINLQTMNDKSASHMAQMLIEGSSMGVPLRYNKDKRKNPVFSRVSAFVVAYSIPFPTLIVNEKSVE